MLPNDTKVTITKAISPMYDFTVGKEAKAQEKKGDVSGNQQFIFDGAKAIYLPETHYSVA